MTKQAMKTGKTSSPIKNIPESVKKVKVVEPFREIKEVQEEALNMGLKKAENLVLNTNEAIAEVTEIGSRNIQAWNGFGGDATGVFRNISSEMMKNYQYSFSNCVEISHEAMGCRTAEDVANLQSKILQRAIEGYFDQSARLSKMLFEGCTKAMEPLNASAVISKRAGV
jgi:hypothetical protein